MKGLLGLAPDKIRMKRTGTSETMCFGKMMLSGLDFEEWIGWLANPRFGYLRPPTKKKVKMCKY